MQRALASEAIGTFFLLACVVGSGIMAERLAGGNMAVALLGNTIATGAMLYVLITILGPSLALTLIQPSPLPCGWKSGCLIREQSAS